MSMLPSRVALIKISVSIPASYNQDLTHLAKVDANKGEANVREKEWINLLFVFESVIYGSMFICLQAVYMAA